MTVRSGSRAEQNAVLHVGCLWSRECRHLDSHPYEHGDPPGMEHSGFRPDQEQAYQGAQGGWQQFFAALEQVLTRIE